MITYKEGNCFLGKTMILSDNFAELEVTLQVGPRVISFCKIGGENIMFQDVDDNVNRDCSSVYGVGKHWHIYGGHRMWLSPEDDATYYPDNGLVSVQKTENGAIFTPEKWDVVNLQPELEVKMLGGGKIEMIHRFRNLNDSEKTLCVWVLTVLKTGGEVTVPLSTEDTGLLANRNLVLWSYTDILDKRITLTNSEFKLRGVKGAATPIKVGLFKHDLQTVYRLGDTTFKKRITAAAGAEQYPDFNCNMETYTSALIHEIETLSPLTNVLPGETITHTELWEIK